MLNTKSKTLKNLDQIMSKHWVSVIKAMEKVVHRGGQGAGENGTAWASIGQYVNYRMAGKSGTAQVVGIAQDEEYNEEELDERLSYLLGCIDTIVYLQTGKLPSDGNHDGMKDHQPREQ